MANAIGLDGRRDERNELIEEYSNASPLLTSHGNDHVIIEDERTSSRHLLFDQVTKLPGIGCSLTSSLRTGYKGWNAASGIMFTIQPSKDIELLTLEIPTFENYAESRKVQVYYRSGDFSGVMNDPSAWTLLADTNARLVSPLAPPGASNQNGLDMGAIVPAKEFQPKSLKMGETYSIYISGQVSSPNPKETLLKLKPSDGLVGEVSLENEEILVRTGVRLKGSSFPSLFTDPADFNGVLHYRSSKSCSDSAMLSTTDIPLVFVVNDEPSSKVMGSLRGAVDEAVSDLLSTDENLVRYSEENMLKMEGIGMHYVGRSEDSCPADFEKCALISATVTFKHLRNLDQGLLEIDILRHRKDLDAIVSSYVSPVETSYAGDPLSKAEFAITLTGVPIGKVMNIVQKLYFQDVTVNFLRNNVDSKVFNVLVTDEDPEIPFLEDGEKPSRTRSRNLVRTPALRATRILEDADDSGGKILIIIEIAAEGSVPELRNMVLEGIGNNLDQFTMELISHQMRPTEINEKEFGDFFAGLKNTQVKPYVPKTENTGPTSSGANGQSTSVGTGGRPEGSVWVIVCILLIVFSFLWLCYRIYIDCFYSPFEKPMKLKGERKDEFKDEDESKNNGTLKKSILGRIKLPSEFPGTSDHSPNTIASSKTDGRNGKKSRSSTNESSLRKSYEAQDSKSFAEDDGLSCSSGDVESSDDEYVKKSYPRRSSSRPQRGKLAPNKSLLAQKRIQPSPNIKKQRKSSTKSLETPQTSIPRRPSSGPKRGRLTATKSMPVQKRSQSSPDIKKQRKSATESSMSETPRRGKLAATKSMPAQKRNHTQKQRKSATKSPKPERSIPRRSPSGTRRGKLTPSKSLPMEKRNVKRTKSMPIAERKKELESKLATKTKRQENNTKDSKHMMPTNPKKRLESRSSHSDSKKLDHRSWHPDSKNLDRKSSHSSTKKIETRSSHSNSKKKKALERKRGIKSSKSKSIERRKSNQEWWNI